MDLDIAQVAASLMKQGGRVVPVALGTKGGLPKGFKAQLIPDPDTPEFFQMFGGGNAALTLGTAFCDVDLDSPGMLNIARVFLPKTPYKWGRKSNPESHWLYRSQNDEKKRTFNQLVTDKDEQAKMLIELRCGDCQSIVPGSYHPSGEQYTFIDGTTDPYLVTPAETEWEDLHRRVTLTALCFGSIATYKTCGQRDNMSHAIASLLCRHGFDQKMSRDLIWMLAKESDDDAKEDRAKKADTVWAKATQD